MKGKEYTIIWFILVIILVFLGLPFFLSWSNPLSIVLNLMSIGLWIFFTMSLLTYTFAPKKYKEKILNFIRNLTEKFFESIF